MSTNDDSASRRGRRADQGEHRGSGRPDRDDRWEQSSSRDRAPADPYQDQRARDIQGQRGGYSNFSRPAYPNQPEPTLPQPQGRYQEPAQRSDSARYVEPAQQAYTPPPPPYEPEPPHLTFDSGRDDLFGRDQGTPALGHNPYASQGASYQSDPYSQNRGQPLTPASTRREEPQYIQREAPASPRDDYERNFPARNAQETQASRFFLPDEEPSQKQRAAQPDRGYTPPPPPPQQQQYPAEAYPPQDQYDAQYEENWADEHAFHEDDGGQRALVADESELDEDFFADEDELEGDHLPAPKRSRKKLMIAAALTGAIVVGGGGAYLYKAVRGGGGEETATPYIRADNRPLKELPGNPGGRQFPNDEKTIYDRLTPDGQQIQAAAYAPPVPAAAPVQPAAGNSLEERIDEALKRAQQANDGSQPVASPPARGPDQPTVVRSESYRPDGTRVDSTGRTTVTPTIVDMNGGQLPPPFGTATQAAAPAPALPAVASPFRTVPVQSTPAPVSAPAARSASLTPAEPTATPTGGYWVSLKSAPDEKAIQRDLTVLTDKYKSVLGDVPLTSKIADLGAKGVHYRAVAGPLSSRQEAMELCQKIKGVGGDKACFVTN